MDPTCIRRGVDLIIGKSGDNLCPVAAMLSFLAARGAGSGPLFQFSDCRYLTRDRLVSELRWILAAAYIDTSQYCGHSFRIGAATTAARAGVEDLLIKTMGKWELVAYLSYIRTSKDQLSAVTARLSSA